jgi:hypothetical protein
VLPDAGRRQVGALTRRSRSPVGCGLGAVLVQGRGELVEGLRNGWPIAPSGNNYAGGLDELAVYATALSATRISAHYTAATS